MSSQDDLQSQKRQFLNEMATKYGFLGDTREVFLERFDESNANLGTDALANSFEWKSELLHPEQKLKDELRNNIYKVLKSEGCPIEEQGRGSLQRVKVLGNRRSSGCGRQSLKSGWLSKALEWMRMLHRLTGTTSAKRCSITSDG